MHATWIQGNGGGLNYGMDLFLTNDLGSTQGATRLRSAYGDIGTAGSPNFSISRSTTTQAYNSNPNTLTYSESLVIDGSNGNVGIGNTNPSNPLTLYKNASQGNPSSHTPANASLKIEDNANTMYLDGNSIVATGTAAFTMGNTAAADFIVYTDATERMRIDSSGNVGIGTTSPNYKLDIEGVNLIRAYNPSGSASIQIKASANNNSSVDFADPDDTNVGQIIYRHADNSMSFDTNDIEKMRITSAGDVGIGTTSPAAPLHVLDDSSANVLAKIRIQGDSTSGYGDIGMQSGYIRLFSNGTMCSAWTGAVQYNYINGSTATTLTSTGFGIGTSSPSYKLHVAGEAGIELFNSSGGGDVLNFRPSLGDAQKYNMSISSYDHSGSGTGAADGLSINGKDGVSIATGTDTTRTERMRIDSSGNVGIGTTSPSAKFEVKGDSSSANLPIAKVISTGSISYLKFFNSSTGTGASDGTYIGMNGGTSYFINKEAGNSYLGTGDAINLTLQNGGNVGIGTTSPKTNLEVIGGLNISTNTTSATTTTMRIGSYGASSQTYYGAKIVAHTNFTSTANTDLSFDLGGLGEVMRLHSSGSEKRVGIGDTTPSYKLDVDGTIRATGDVIAYSDKRVKENIKTIDNSLEKVNQLRGVEFNKIGEDKKSIGVIAQEIEKILPEVVREDDKGMKSVAYGNITGILIEAIKELTAKVERLENNKCNCK